MKNNKIIALFFALCVSFVLLAFVSSAECDHIPALGDSIEATCTDPGHTAGTWCALCGQVLIEEEEIPALGHDYSVVAVEKLEPTCISSGREARMKCVRCDETIGGERIPKVDYHTPEVIPAVAPTCTETGLAEGSKCKHCGIILVEQAEVPSLGGHVDSNFVGKCEVCGTELEEDFCAGCGAMPHGNDILGIILRFVYTVVYRTFGIDNRCCYYLPWMW